jgi:opacity protein-like surface antigen
MKKITILLTLLVVLCLINPAKEMKKPVKKGKAVAAAKAEEKLFSGYFAKFGLMTTPPASFGDKWLLSFGKDWGIINPFLAAGFEVQPYYRHFSTSDFSDSTLGANLFANAKGGVNIGRFVEKLDFLTPYIGFGLGVALASSSSTFDSEKVSRASFNFAWHLMFGIEVALKKMRLMLEFQTVKVSVPGISPDAAQHFMMLGVRF